MKPNTLVAAGLCLTLEVLGAQNKAPAFEQPPAKIENITLPLRTEAHLGAVAITSILNTPEFIPNGRAQPTATKSVPAPGLHITPKTNKEAVVSPEVVPSQIEPGTITWIGDSLSEGANALAPGSTLHDMLAGLGFTDIMDDKATCGLPIVGERTYKSCERDNPYLLTARYLIQEPDIRDHIAKSSYVVLALGTNDHGQSPESFAAALVETIETVRAINSETKIVLVTTFLRGKDDYKHINEVIRSTAEKYSLIHVDFDMEVLEEVDYAKSCSDGTHPCPKGYKDWISSIRAVLEKSQRDSEMPIALVPKILALTAF